MPNYSTLAVMGINNPGEIERYSLNQEMESRLAFIESPIDDM